MNCSQALEIEPLINTNFDYKIGGSGDSIAFSKIFSDQKVHGCIQ